MIHRWVVMLTVVMGLAVAPHAAAQDAAAQPDAKVEAKPAGQPDIKPKAARALTVAVVDFKGIVRVREQADRPWRPPQRGIRLTQGAEFRTGPRSYVTLLIEAGQIIILDRLGVMKVITAIHDPTINKIKTDYGMKYGRTRLDVETAETPHEATIYSPNATLAVRGTDAQLRDGDGFPTTITSNRGRILADIGGYKAVAMGGTAKATATEQRPTPALEARLETTIDTRGEFVGRTGAEATVIELSSQFDENLQRRRIERLKPKGRNRG